MKAQHNWTLTLSEGGQVPRYWLHCYQALNIALEFWRGIAIFLNVKGTLQRNCKFVLKLWRRAPMQSTGHCSNCCGWIGYFETCVVKSWHNLRLNKPTPLCNLHLGGVADQFAFTLLTFKYNIPQNSLVLPIETALCIHQVDLHVVYVGAVKVFSTLKEMDQLIELLSAS